MVDDTNKFFSVSSHSRSQTVTYAHDEVLPMGDLATAATPAVTF